MLLQVIKFKKRKKKKKQIQKFHYVEKGIGKFKDSKLLYFKFTMHTYITQKETGQKKEKVTKETL